MDLLSPASQDKRVLIVSPATSSAEQIKKLQEEEKHPPEPWQSSWPRRHQRPASDLCLRQSVKAESVTPIPEHKEKNKENAVLICISSRLPGIKSENVAWPESS